MSPEYLQKYYQFERSHWWFIVREKILRQQLNASLPLSKPLKILNAGAATGKSSQMLEAYGDVISVEKDPEACLFLRAELALNVVECDLVSLPFENDFFDVVCIFDVIEHVEQEELAVAELYRVCKPGGLLYCSVPAFQSLWSTHDEVNHHKRRYSLKAIKEIFDKKFVVEYSTFFNFFLFPLIWFSRVVLQKRGKSAEMVSDFEHSRLLNGRFFSFLFKTIFSIELLLLRFFSFPFGVSILLRARKRGVPSQNNKHL